MLWNKLFMECFGVAIIKSYNTYLPLGFGSHHTFIYLYILGGLIVLDLLFFFFYNVFPNQYFSLEKRLL